MFATGFPGMIAPPSIWIRFSMLGAYPTVQYNCRSRQHAE
jgi:hypothetical protein